MRKFAPIVLISLAALVLGLTVFGADGLAKLQELRASLEAQETKNAQSRRQVGSVKEEVDALQHQPRALERLARDELGMARPGEFIFIFEAPENKESAN